MQQGEMSPKQRREGAPLVRMLQEKLLSCHNNDGELNVAELASKIGRTRQLVHSLLNKEMLSESVAYRLLVTFPRELTVRDLRPFVQRD